MRMKVKKCKEEKTGRGPILITRRCPNRRKNDGSFTSWFEKGEIAECGESLYTTPFCPVYELHASIDVVAKSYTHSECHCNKRDPLCHHRCFNKAF